jgi:hypothetical protein
MFRVALFIVAKIWNPPRCPSTDEWIQHLEYKHYRVLFSNKKEWSYAIYRKMNGTRDHHVK